MTNIKWDIFDHEIRIRRFDRYKYNLRRHIFERYHYIDDLHDSTGERTFAHLHNNEKSVVNSSYHSLASRQIKVIRVIYRWESGDHNYYAQILPPTSNQNYLHTYSLHTIQVPRLNRYLYYRINCPFLKSLERN